MKRGVSLMLVLVLTLGLALPAGAVQPRALTWSGDLTFEDQVAYCMGHGDGDWATDYIEITMKLWQGNLCLATWEKSGYISVGMEETCPVMSRVTYTLTVDVTINGVHEGTITRTGRCP